MRAVKIRSDSSEHRYLVRLDDHGRAVHCNCPARGQCKHLERAELVPAFLQARRTITAHGSIPAESFDATFRAIVRYLGGPKRRTAVNEAIKAVLDFGRFVGGLS